ncbi:MAG TPA: DUF2127 domain-containing protein [Casimicrobiaceae bacterium]|jgi:uncharacterized membrane protein
MNTTPQSPTEVVRTHRLFEMALVLKGLNGIVELAGGTLAFFVPLQTVNRLVLWVIASEWEDDLPDWLAGVLEHATENLSMGTKLYASFYLLAHGIVKIFLVYSLWREKIWAFPAALLLMSLLVGYSIYRFTHTHAVALLVFAAVDLVIMWAIWREYLVRREIAEPDSGL